MTQRFCIVCDENIVDIFGSRICLDCETFSNIPDEYWEDDIVDTWEWYDENERLESQSRVSDLRLQLQALPTDRVVCQNYLSWMDNK